MGNSAGSHEKQYESTEDKPICSKDNKESTGPEHKICAEIPVGPVGAVGPVGPVGPVPEQIYSISQNLNGSPGIVKKYQDDF